MAAQGQNTAIFKVDMQIKYIIMKINIRISIIFHQIPLKTFKSDQILTKMGHLVGFPTFFLKSDHCRKHGFSIVSY